MKMIPKIVWQTYETPKEFLPDYAKEAMLSWEKLNPHYEFKYMDSNQRDEFVLKHFGDDWYKIFSELPSGVMRACIWRYMILYVYGGIYLDLDIICKQPINSWVDHTKDLVVSISYDKKNLQHFAFASSINNEFILNTLKDMKKQFDAPDYKEKASKLSQVDFLFEYGSDEIITKSAKKTLNFPKDDAMGFDLAWQTYKDSGFVKKQNMVYYGLDQFDLFNGEGILMEHLFGSVVWNDGKYVQWQTEDLGNWWKNE
jgi:hypothetical protein